jgi:serine/threonine protein kinase/Tfp pilus assembly protein PilF
MGSMGSERWQRAQALFHDALALPEEKRNEFLLRECSDDLALRDDVLALLAEDARGDSLLERDLSHLAHEVFEASPPRLSSIGPYRVLRVLGQGGMGVVYLAEHLGRRVAIKVLRDAPLSAVRRERFEREKQLLAQLVHPAIARLYEADTLPDDTPYFVMEYVEGGTITQFCSERGCSISERLALFREVCEAVQYAHREAVVHRDLKPSNILVTPQGKVTLLDFGIAKQIEGLDRGSHGTHTGQHLMTPAYAAPEQLRGDAVGVYTDIYALGLILYELLATVPCFDLRDCTPAHVAETVLRWEPTRPSLRAASAAPSTHARLSRAHWAELDLICLTALHKEPQRRYSSVEALIRDLDHYRYSEPLDARPDDLAYRARKFLVRNRHAVAGFSLALAAVLSVAAFYTVQLAKERGVAQAEAAKGREVSEYLIGLFEANDPLGEGEPAQDIRSLLDRGVERAESLAAQPQVQAQMFNVLGRVYTMLSEYEQAEKLLKRALVLRKTDKTDIELAETLTNIGVLYRYDSKFEEAEKLTRQALAIRERELPATHPDLAVTLDNLGVVLSNEGRYAEASAVLHRALDIRRSSYAQPHPLVGHTLNNLAVNEFNEGHYDEAERYYREALGISKATYGPNHAYTAVDLANLGVLLDTKGNYAEADVMMSEALRITRERLGENHYETAFRMTQLGGMLRRKGDYDRAEGYLRKSLEIEGRVLEPNHRNTGVTLNHLALTLQERHRYAEAESFMRRAAEVFRERLGPQHAFTGTVTCSVGYLLHLQGRNPEAEVQFREGLRILSTSLPAGHDMIALNESRYGVLLTSMSRFEEAEQLLARSYGVLKKAFGEQHKDTLETGGRLAALYLAWGKPESAAPYQRGASASPRP